MAGLRISVHGSKELQALILRLARVDKDMSSEINKQTRKVAEPIWKEAVAANADDALESRVLANTARVSVTRSNVTLRAGGIGRALSGGGKPPELVAGTEFGGNRDASLSYYTVHRGSRTWRVKNRHTQRQFRPRNRKGYVVYPAAAKVIPRLASLWVQTAVRTLHEAIEGK